MPDRPNILLLFTDDQRAGTIGALGNPHIHTPNLDALVRRGTAYTQAYIMGGSCPAVCMPSRAMLMTGRTLFGLQGQGESIPRDHTLLGEHLRRHGYATWGTGKWHNGPEAYARSFSGGAEIFFGGMDDHWNVPACDFDPTGRYEARPMTRDPWRSNAIAQRRCDHIRPGVHSSELFAEATVGFLRSYQDDAPFFAYVSFMAPHDPRTMPPEYLAMYDPDRIELPPNAYAAHPFDNGELVVRDELLAARPRVPVEIRRHLAEYYAMISHLDAQIGRILAALEASGHAEDTLVLLAGDNGLALGQHGLMGKQNLYDHSLHVPLVMAGPGVPHGELREAPCYLLDLFPTLCDLTALPTPASGQGRSLAPTLADPSARPRQALYFAYRDYQRAVQNGTHKLIEYCVDGVRHTQLYDRGADPWELNSVADLPSGADTRAHLTTALLQARAEMGDRSPGFWGTYGA